MQARNPTVKALNHSDPTRDRGWILVHEDDFFAAENEESGTEAQEHEFPARREKRETVFRVAEYSRYPRVDRDQRRLNAFVRNESTSGMCLVSDQAEPVASTIILHPYQNATDVGTPIMSAESKALSFQNSEID